MKVRLPYISPTRYCGLLVIALASQLASAQGVIGFAPVKNLYTASPNYLATNIWSTWVIDGITQPIIYLETPNPRSDRVCPDGTNNYYGDAAKMTGLSISVTPNTNYTIQAKIWVFDQRKGPGAAINVNPTLSFRVNNQAVKMDSFPIDKWTVVTGTWNSGSSTSVSSLGIWNDQGAGCGNDYMIAGAPTQVAPSISVSKAMGAPRVNDTDQFTLQIKSDSNTVVNATANSTTTGRAATVDTNTGSTGPTTLSPGAQYTIVELPSGTSKLAQYTSKLSCTDASNANRPLLLNTPFALQSGDAVSCRLINTPVAATLQLRQIVLSPVPVNLRPPYTFSYTGNNGWSAPAISNTALNIASSSNPIALTATNTDTTVFTTLPDARWLVSSFTCVDMNAAISGNPSGNLAMASSRPTVTVPAAYVRAAAALRCTLVMGHLTP